MSRLDNDSSRSTVVLHRDARAPRQVRRVVHDMCTSSALAPRAVGNAMFVAGELVSRSVRHAAGPLLVEMSIDEDNLTVRVRYSAPPGGPAAHAKPAFGAMRSWDVVKRLSTSFGYASTGTEHEVWANLSASARSRSSSDADSTAG